MLESRNTKQEKMLFLVSGIILSGYATGSIYLQYLGIGVLHGVGSGMIFTAGGGPASLETTLSSQIFCVMSCALMACSPDA